MKKRLTALALAMSMAAVSLTGCAGTAKETTAQTEGTTASETVADTTKEVEETTKTESKGDIAVTYVKSPLNVPSIVEKDQNIFANAFAEIGYDNVVYSDLTTGPEQTQALASGDIQFLYAVGATSVILSASNGADIKIISTYSRSPEAFKLFSDDAEIDSPEELRGKKVAGPKGTILHELLVAYLATADMTEADIEFMSMGIPDAQAALAGGSVDAALAAGPAAYNMEKDGFSVVTDGTGLTEATIVVATSGAYAESHPEEVKTFLEAQEEILNYIEENNDAAMAATAKETELTPEAVAEMYPMYDFDMSIKDSDIEAMKKTEEFMYENAMIEERVNIEELILTVE